MVFAQHFIVISHSFNKYGHIFIIFSSLWIDVITETGTVLLNLHTLSIPTQNIFKVEKPLESEKETGISFQMAPCGRKALLAGLRDLSVPEFYFSLILHSS